MTTRSSSLTHDVAIEAVSAGLLSPMLRALDPYMSYATYPKGSTLLVRGQAVNGVYFVVEGSVKLSIASDKGTTVILGIARPGEALGLSAAVAGAPSEVTAVTITPSQVCFVGRDEFLSALALNGESCFRVVELLSQQLREALELIRIIGGAQSAKKKLAALLLNWAASMGKESDQGIEINLHLREEEIGQMIGASRATVSRLLVVMKRNQILSVNGSSIYIFKKSALEEMAAKRRRRTVEETSQDELRLQ